MPTNNEMTPRDMFIEGIIAFQYPGNYRKRVDRIDRLATAIGATVAYGMNTPTCSVQLGERWYEANGLRQTERLLRRLNQTEEK